MSYTIWTLFIKSFIKIGRRYCSTATRRLSSTHFEQDFFGCINYMSLKQELKSTTTQLRKMRGWKETGNHNQTHLSEEKLDSYINWLEARRTSIKATIKAFFI